MDTAFQVRCKATSSGLCPEWLDVALVLLKAIYVLGLGSPQEALSVRPTWYQFPSEPATHAT